MIYEFFHILLWITAILIIISGLDDLFIDILYWFNRRKYKKNLPSFSEMNSKAEKPIAIMIGAWKEDKVIGRTLTIALKKMRYSNYRFFLAVYPNDLPTVKVVREIARKDHRVILCLNPNDGPTTKADNLNNAFTCVKEYEKHFGEFDIILIHDSEDFIHPLSLKLFNYLIMYKGNYAVQIPVIPIKSRLGKMIHRTYCDSFAELHTKDMIVRQSIGSYIPFSGTGMAFSRKAFHYLEAQSIEMEKRRTGVVERQDRTSYVESDQEHFAPDVEKPNDLYPEYEDIPIPGWDDEQKRIDDQKPKSELRKYSILGTLIIILGLAFGLYASNDVFSITGNDEDNGANGSDEIENVTPAGSGIMRNKEYFMKKYPAIRTNLERGYNKAPEVPVEPYIVNTLSNREYNVVFEELSNQKYRIQESAWESLSLAQERQNKIKTILNGNVTLKITDTEIDGKVWHKIIMGDYYSYEDALSSASKLREQLR
ncbi:MAG: glycosyltransferase [Ignavibacteriaceae bacterium]|mgnify:CR=1 FL=1|jgi:hypothetical protein|nr:MAG: hypothetical protein EDM69_05350 [Chlorobiota bacterium]KXK06087.1 MAG: bacteriophage N4 adsorption protein B [Chlorobi bacterium OLB4]MBV6398519.1 hypothetical protein [Ignavibacteria bacterium]MCC6885754.1 glycosyltransferase [Ignavibacteriales bacterium]MCE7953051.1 hypothetical protein [Chlorobi bacterium CHB7]MDL1887111.1 hypothetical protein [Ignavibacteria bacterium CHB1]MEB2329166.1 glycosyltransferase [Ignavibacteriaceae bacterium]OQY78004.1 MAG: hypothetical protein B6D43_0